MTSNYYHYNILWMTNIELGGNKSNRFLNDNDNTSNNEDFRELLINKISTDNRILDKLKLFYFYIHK